MPQPRRERFPRAGPPSGDGTASLAGGFTSDPAELIAARSVMGLGAAMTFPATLSLLSNVFTDRTERARAIGLWDAIAGVAIATGPIVGAGCWSTSPDSRQFTCTFPIPQASSGLTATQGRDPEPSEWQTFGTIDWAAAGHFTRLLARQVLTDGMPAVVPVLNLNVPRGATTHTEPQDDAEPAPLTVTPSSATRWRRLSR